MAAMPWPDLFRPSTSLDSKKPEGVDARHKAGHDDILFDKRLTDYIIEVRD
jgi:hypothetical protein